MRHQPIDASVLRRFFCYRLTRLKLSLSHMLSQRMAAHEVNASQFAVLVLVNANPGVFLRQLSQALDISPPNLVPVIESLVVRGALERQSCPRDRRLQQLYLTAEGAQLLQACEQTMSAFEQDLADPLQPEEFHAFKAALDKLYASLLDKPPH